MPKTIDQPINRLGAHFHAIGVAMVFACVLVGCVTDDGSPSGGIPIVSRVIHFPFLDGGEPTKPAAEQTAPAQSLEDPAEDSVRLVPADDPMLAEARIRGVYWPMVYNEGAHFQHKPQAGLCSYYNESQRTATGEHYNPEAMTAAHKTLPFGTIVRCTRSDTGDSVVVVINDRGPFVRGRIIDLSRRAAQRIGMIGDGVAPCRIEILAYPLIEAMGPKGNG